MKVVFKNERRQAKYEADRLARIEQHNAGRAASMARFRPGRNEYKRAETLSRHRPHSSLREVVRANTRPGSAKRHACFVLAYRATAYGDKQAEKDLGARLDS